MANDGIQFVSDDEVPEPPRETNRYTEVYLEAEKVLAKRPLKWAKVVESDSPTYAPAKASAINGDRVKQFPAANWQARASRGESGSMLFMRYVPEEA